MTEKELKALANADDADPGDLQAALCQVLGLLGPPTDAMEFSVRGMLMYEGRRTYGEMRDHCIRGTWGIKHWPKWALDAPDSLHIPKANFAALIWETMANTGLAASANQDSSTLVSPEK